MKKIDHARLDHVVLAARQAADSRAEGYREKALKLYPWISAAAVPGNSTHANLAN